MTIQEILARIHQLEAITNTTINELSNHFPYGDLNQVVVTNGDQTNTLKAIDVVSDGNFVVTDQELADAQTHFVSQATIFNSWFRFSHGTNTGGLHPTPSNQLPGTPLETNSWVYDSVHSVITSTENTPSFIGFVSPDQYHRYTHTVTLNAAIEDDDYLAVIIAFIEDKNDMVPNAAYGLNPANFTWPINTTDTHIPNQHTLSLVRSRTTKTGFPLNDVTEYAIVYNWNKPDQVMLANGNSLVWSVPNIAYGANGNSTDVKIVREDDIITCYTTDWDDAPGGKGALGHPLQIDLTANPLTEKFRGSASYGYGALSQPNASYTNIYMNPNVNNIYDLRDGSVWLADNVGVYIKDPTKSFFDLYGVRRILHNPITKKTFYMRPDKQWELLSETGNFVTDITKPDPNVNTLRVFKGTDYFDIEITTGGSSSGGSGGTASRFGIEDNIAIQDRSINMQGHQFNFALDGAIGNKYLQIEGSSNPYVDIYIDDSAVSGNTGEIIVASNSAAISAQSLTLSGRFDATSTTGASMSSGGPTGNSKVSANTGEILSYSQNAGGGFSALNNLDINANDPTNNFILLSTGVTNASVNSNSIQKILLNPHQLQFISNYSPTGATTIDLVQNLVSPSVLTGNYTIPLSVNGTFADSTGNITISAGGGTTPRDLTTLTDPAFYDIPAGDSLLNAWIIPSSDATTSIGWSAGAGDIASPDVTTAADGKQYVLNLFAKSTKRIFFTGLPTGSTVIVQTKKIL